MPSTFTSYLNLEKPGLGEQTNVWGSTLNSNFDKLDTGVKANHDGLAPIAGMQTDIANLKTSDSAQNTTLTSLQSQITALTNRVAACESNIGTIQSQITDIYNKIAGNTNSIGTINNTTIPNLQNQINTHTSQISGLQTQINAIPPPVDITIAEQDLNSGTLTGHWVTVHLDNHKGTVCTLGFGMGTGQQGDVVTLPSGMVNYAWQPMMQTIAAENIPNPIEYFHVNRSGLSINQASGSTSGNAFDRGVVTASWTAMAYKRS